MNAIKQFDPVKCVLFIVFKSFSFIRMVKYSSMHVNISQQFSENVSCNAVIGLRKSLKEGPSIFWMELGNANYSLVRVRL